MAEPTGSTPVVEDDAETGEYTADGEFGAETPSEYTTESSQDAPARAVARRPVVTGHAAGTGRRKEAIARVRILPGSGQWTINGRTGWLAAPFWESLRARGMLHWRHARRACTRCAIVRAARAVRCVRVVCRQRFTTYG